jgi:hypothetical protein
MDVESYAEREDFSETPAGAFRDTPFPVPIFRKSVIRKKKWRERSCVA